MEMLIRKHTNWMDLPKNQDRVNELLKDDNFKTKYDIREKPGDIVQIERDGYWSGKNGKGYNKEKFRLICLPNINIEIDTLPLFDDVDKSKIIKLRKYSIEIKDLVFDGKEKTEVTTLQDAENIVKINVKDDGKGFDLMSSIDQLATQGKLGLIGMQEKAKSIGGLFELNTARNEGTIVSLQFKL